MVQRVSRASVRVEGEVIGQVGTGFLVLLGVAKEDPPGDEELLAKKIAGLRVFPDEAGKMNLSLLEVKGGALVVSQFTLLADTSRGRRPSFIGAAPPEEADRRYQAFCAALRAEGVPVETGRFAASMEVELINQGPVTILMDTRELR